MTFLPIVERELRVFARKPNTVWARFFAALAVTLLWLLLVGGTRFGSPTELGQRLFMAFGVLSMGFCLLAGVFLTADCLSEEKREGTLGLLFLTDLRGYDVVLGKLIATSIRSVYGLMAIFPLLALPLLMGGVTGGEFWRVVLVLLVTLALSLCLGLFISALNREARHSMAGTLLVMLMLAGVLPLWWWLFEIVSGSRPPGWLLLPSPVQTFRAAFDACYRTRVGPSEFWLSVMVLSCLSLGCLFAAAVLLPRVWQERNRTSPTSPTPGPAENIGSVRRPSRLGASRASLLEANPYYWLAARSRSSITLTGVAVGLLSLIWFCFFAASILSSKYREAFIVCLFTSYALHQIVKYLLAVEATRQLSEDRASGALELLLVTPLKEAQIVSGHAVALRQRFAPQLVVLVLVNLFLCGSVLFGAGNLKMNTTDQAIFLELFLGGLLMLFLDFKAIQTLSVWMALRSKRHGRAALATLLRILGVPWMGILLMVFLRMNGGSSAGEVAAIFAFWFVAGLVTDLVVLAQAQTGLSHGFRACLTEARAGANQPAPFPRPTLLTWESPSA